MMKKNDKLEEFERSTECEFIKKALHKNDHISNCEKIEKKLYTNLYYYSNIQENKRNKGSSKMRNFLLSVSSVAFVSLFANMFFIGQYTKNPQKHYGHAISFETFINSVENERDIEKINKVFLNNKNKEIVIDLPSDINLDTQSLIEVDFTKPL